ncbi:uncharacterized protein VP01_1367g6 [Puccinia sorghi]|uniref:DDE Tnp4 domain-containing protein n=1 Tax=Puccinia sorghi TaxID=27349 RepID=A0A0L6VNL4_9BASI|nr:uncharacterized protein VP01_1367g6 [Puccinia sorghi]
MSSKLLQKPNGKEVILSRVEIYEALAGYPGSCYNSYLFDQSQFLLGESAYASDQYAVPDYQGKELLDQWNVYFLI